MAEPTKSFEAGFECKLYIGSPGVDAAMEVSGLRNLNYDSVLAELKTTTRADGAMETYRPGRNDLSIAFDIPWQPLDAAFNALRAAFTNRQAISAAVSDAGEGEAEKGFEGDWFIFQFSKSEPEGDVSMVSVRLKPTNLYGRLPTMFDI